MAMPILPGLVGEDAAGESEGEQPALPEGQPADLTAVFDSLSEEDVADLTSQAAEAYDAGELDEIMGAPPEEGEETAADEAAESPEDQAAEAAAGTEQHDAATYATEIETRASELEMLDSQMEELLAAVKESDEGDPKPVEEAQEAIQAALDACEENIEKATAAVDDNDIDAAAEACAAVDDLYKRALAAVEVAKAKAREQSLDAEPGEPDEDGNVETSPLSIWVDKNS